MRNQALGKCAVHQDVDAAEICGRCGAFACASCLEFTDTEPSQTLCANCYQRYFGQKASSRAVTGLVLGVVGFSSCWLIGLPAWILGQQELEAIERGEAPQKGKNLALGAKWLGLIQLGLTGLALVAGLIAFLVSR